MELLNLLINYKGRAMKSMFDTLLELPLFQGISTKSLTKILEKAKLHFERRTAGETIVRSGSRCDGLVFILHGEVEKTTVGMGESAYEVTEYLDAPYLLEPASVFGLTTSYRSTYIAGTDVDTMSVSKVTIADVLMKNEVFRLNYLNTVCRRMQNLENTIWESPLPTSTSIVCHSILNHFETLTGRKSLFIDINDLASKGNILRINVKQALKGLEKNGLLQIKGRSIEIPDASLLVAYSHSIVEGGLDEMS